MLFIIITIPFLDLSEKWIDGQTVSFEYYSKYIYIVPVGSGKVNACIVAEISGECSRFVDIVKQKIYNSFYT